MRRRRIPCPDASSRPRTNTRPGTAFRATAIGAALGAVIAHWLPAAWLNQMLPVVVFGCGLYLLFGTT